MKVANVQDAIKAIADDYKEQGEPVNVVIFGHGMPGHIKLGEDFLEHKTPEGQAAQEKFVAGLVGKINTLYLYGCSIGKGKQGQAFIKKLSKELRCPIHAWTGKVFAFPNKWVDGTAVDPNYANKFFVEGEKKDVDIPAVTEWGLVVMALLVLAAGTVVIRRARAIRA